MPLLENNSNKQKSQNFFENPKKTYEKPRNLPPKNPAFFDKKLFFSYEVPIFF